MTGPLRQVTVVGLGLIGGSIAKALRRRDRNLNLLAVDRGDVGKRSDVKQLVTKFIELESLGQHRASIAQSDLVVLCQPVRIIASDIGSYVRPECVVTDTGSTKRHIVEVTRELAGAPWYVPGHPMAGKERGGFENANPDLFVSRPWIVCREGRHPDAVARVEAFVDSLGARRISMTPEAHDAAVAVISHVPQVLASALFVAGSARTALSVAGPAFTEMTRTAGGDENIWRDIFETNADEVGEVLRNAAVTLDTLANGLLSDPIRVEPTLELLRKAREAKGK